MTPHPKIDAIVETYLSLADAEAPGLVEGLYLEGSAALDDYRPDTSDVDFVAVTAAEPPIGALARIHHRLGAHPFEGVYLTWDDLRRNPSDLGERPQAHAGKLALRGGVNPVTWHTLAHHGVTCRGPKPAELDIWTDPAALAAWTDDNLDRYWRRLVTRASRLPSPWGLATLGGYGAVWIVTGVSRMHYTLATGDVTSKTGAARHALEVFPERWHRVVDEALRLRADDTAQPSFVSLVSGLSEHFGADRRSLYASPFERRSDVLGFADQAIVAAHELYAAR
ncbi:aminoglycoside adenylyltransferase domain-containing protein [Nonomuraea sp. SYSU D8015]|uniref:aminoglycoside adenylyltransferase domain-containing protein n=1 Tax=Nonomuraea sp. SYSU D8015 TaxID=2593644 RepID=UPI0016610044|nr:aminoglycoside adenylyltransferase domain-containing protein [Nonomuraea sp. SYSU D8015]